MKNILLQILNIELSRKKTGLSPLSFLHLPFSQREEKNLKAFTLVELIVVITILAILGTIAFLSFQSYTVYARDAVRISNLRNLESGLKIQYTQGGAYAVPDDSVNITASGTLIRQQGVFGKQSSRTIKANTDGTKDPLTGEYYDYVVDNNLSEYQLVGYMEGEEAFNSNHLSGAKNNKVPDMGFRVIDDMYANTGSTMRTLGQDLGIVFSGGVAVHITGTDIDIRQPTGELTIVFSEDDEITDSDGSVLFSNVYNRSRKLLNNKGLAILDESLVLYYDMETTTMSGSELVLKDLSMYENHGECMDAIENSVDCGTSGPLFTKSKEGTSVMYFSGEGSYIKVKDGPALRGLTSFTLGSKQELNDPNPISKLIGKRDGLRKFIFLGHNSEKPYVGISNDYSNSTASQHVMNGTQKFPVGRIYSSALTFSNDSLEGKLYMNGLLDRSQVMGSYDPDLDAHFNIGLGEEGFTNYFKGNIDEVRIYNRALSDKEIKTIYGSTLEQ